MLPLVLIIAAFLCFVLAAASAPSGRFNLIGAGLACWTLSLFVERL